MPCSLVPSHRRRAQDLSRYRTHFAQAFVIRGGIVLKHKTSRELYDYWDRIRGGDPAPRRSDIEPGDIRSILADTFILEAEDRTTSLIRLAGTRMCALYGREIKGQGFFDFWSDDDRPAIATLATAVTEDGAGAVISANLFSSRQRPAHCEFLLLPLRHGGPAYDRVLGSCAAFERPFWFGSEPIIRQRIVSMRLIWPDSRPHFMRPFDRRSPPPPHVDGPGLRRRGHLFVLDGGKP